MKHVYDTRNWISQWKGGGGGGGGAGGGWSCDYKMQNQLTYKGSNQRSKYKHNSKDLSRLR